MKRKKRTRPPTPSAIAVWDALDRLTSKHKRPPTMRDVMRATGKKSTSLTVRQLDRGVREGRVARVRIGHVFGYVPRWWIKMINDNIGKYYGQKN